MVEKISDESYFTAMEKTKKTRRKIEDKIRKEFTPEKIEALAILLDIFPVNNSKKD